METKYKKFVVDYLFGLLEGSPRALEEALKDDLLLEFNLVPKKIEVIGTDKFIKKDGGYDIWIGTMTVNLTIDDEDFNVTRNWEEEYYVDITHPNYANEDFYDSHKPYSSKKYREIINSFN